MYNPREDLYGEYEEDYELSENESLWSPGLSSRSTSLSLTPLTPPPLFEDDEIYFPSYDDYESHSTPENDAGIPSPESESSSPEVPSSAVRISHGLQIERPEDDTAVRVQPSRHIDYLSHDWKEEELWASWKYVVSRRNIYSNSARLENASWRAWEKKRRNLKTTSPETVRWLKDHDVTWLYGPLQPSFCTWDRSQPSDAEPRRNSAPPDSPHFPMKPILKKRSLSELMLRRSTSSASILKPAVLNHDSSSSLFSTPGLTRANTSPCSSSTNLNPSLNSWKMVRFHELVEQCIALTNPPDDPFTPLPSRRTFRSSSLPSPTSPSAGSPSTKTIQKLPHAPLKSPEPEAAPRLSISRGIQTPAITPPTPLFLVGDDEEEEVEEEEEDDDWRPPSWMQGRRDSVHLFRDRLEAIKRDLGTSTLPSPSSSISISNPPAPPTPTATPFQLPPSPPPPCLSDTTSSSSSSNDEDDDDDDYDYISYHDPSSSSSFSFKPAAVTPMPLTNRVAIVDSVRDTCTAEMERGFRDWEVGLMRHHWDHRDWELELAEEEAWTMAV